ncbi:GNAT family N-acetyltransferase [Arthrobacter sp. NPDC090010]|uniref:GNAT family N-acetyltransferase n=1 Tax=Arthrobacter sp. NPDC090010 TaxID=3363942 RepID=UPI003803257E
MSEGDPAGGAHVPGQGSPGTLETARLILRPWRVTDAFVSRRLWTERDPRVPAHRRIDAEGHPTVEDLEDWVRRYEHSPHPGLLVAELRNSGQVIGYCGLTPTDHGLPEEPELAFEFLRSVWRQGFATEAATAVLEYARAEGHTRFWATVWDWNIASRRVLAKLGFVETGDVEPRSVHGRTLLTVASF